MHKRWQWGGFCLLWAAIHSFLRSFHTCDFQWNDSWLVWSQSIAFDAIRDAPLSDQQVLCLMHYYHFWMNFGFKVGYSRQKVMLCARWFAVCRRSLTFETLSCIAHGHASSLRLSDFDVWMKIMCGWRTMVTFALFFHATYCCSVMIIRASVETSDALFKRVKPCFGFCLWTKFVWCLYLLSMTTNIASSLTVASAWITPSFWIGIDSWWSWMLQKQPSRIFASTEYTQ